MNKYDETQDVAVQENSSPTRRQVYSLKRSQIKISKLPSPEDIARYKEVMPDLPDRIVKQFEEDSIVERELKKERQSADIELQKNAQKADVDFDKRSQLLAFLVIMTGLLGTFWLVYLDKDIAAILTGLATAVWSFKGFFNKSVSTDDSKDVDKEK